MAKIMHKYKYVLPENGQNITDASTFGSTWSTEHDFQLTWIAEDAAQHYWDMQDGWDSSWPLRFDVYTEDDKLVGRFTLELEHRPQFVAVKEK